MYQDCCYVSSAPCGPCGPCGPCAPCGCDDYMARKFSVEKRVSDYSYDPYQSPPQRRGSKTPMKSTSKTRGSIGSKAGKVKSNYSFTYLSDTKKSESSSSSSSARNSKQMKNSQNYQFQDMLGKKQMEVINEEKEPVSEGELPSSDSSRNKKIQDSCADFLSIVHDNVIDTVQKSVESILREYFVHTMEKVEGLCSQMMRNECLLSKMYLDVMDKIADQNERNLRQFKCICQFLTETRYKSQFVPGSEVDIGDEPMCCPCPKRQSRNEHARNNYSRNNTTSACSEDCMRSCFGRKPSLNGSTESHRQNANATDSKYTSSNDSKMRMPSSQYMRVPDDLDQTAGGLTSDALHDLRYMRSDIRNDIRNDLRNDIRNEIPRNDNSILSTRDSNTSSDRRHYSGLKSGQSVSAFNRKMV